MDVLILLKDFASALRTGQYQVAMRIAGKVIALSADLWDIWKPSEPTTFSCPCDPNDLHAVADWIDKQCADCTGGTAVASVPLPWKMILSLMIEVVKKFLEK